MTRAKDISKILTDANISGTLDVSGALTGTSATLTGDITASSLNSGQFAVNNMILNGNMAINQRGATSGVTSGYFVDRFTLSGCSASAVITSSTPTQFPTAITVSATSGNPIISQKIESKNVQHLSGKVVTASFFAKNISNATTLFASLQHANSADNFGATTTITETNLGNLTSDWVKYTASYTVPSGGLNGLSLNILCSGTSTFTMGVTGVMLQEGSVATPFQHRSFGEEHDLCKRYYQKSFEYATAVGASTQLAGWSTGGPNGATTTGYIEGTVNFEKIMRAIPTMTIYDYSGNSGKCTRLAAGTARYHNSSVNTSNLSSRGLEIISTTGTAAGLVQAHYTADAEL